MTSTLVSNNYISNNPDIPVATTDIAGEKYQRVILYSDSGSPANTTTVATLSSVAGSASQVDLLPANTARKSASVYNESSAILYLAFGPTVSTTSYKVQLSNRGYFEFPQPIFTGQVVGIWASATGNARISEET